MLNNNKRIAKNTFILYLRLLVTTLISLYTIRIVLEVLGVEDYGIYNVTGSIIILFSFVSGTMRTTTQRFLSFEMGKTSIGKLNNVFSQSIYSYFLIIILFIIISETLGLWMLNHVLLIPDNRMIAANIAYQMSILSFIVMILGEPYYAAIIAMEEMKLYAYGTIILSVLNLIGALVLKYFYFQDYLVAYVFFLFFSNLAVTLFYISYCSKHYEFCSFRFVRLDKGMIKRMTLFSFWNMLGQITNLLRKQGVNILLGMFFNPAVNAARGISLKVNMVINQLSSNFYTAVRPQLVKDFSAGNMVELFNLCYMSSRISFFLLLLLLFPVVNELDFILHLWLNEVPAYTILFTKIILFTTIIEVLYIPLDHMIQASGNLKVYQLFVCTINILNIPISYFLFRLGYGPESALYVNLFLILTTSIPRLIIVKNVLNMSIRNYIKAVVIPLFPTIMLSSIWYLLFCSLEMTVINPFLLVFLHFVVIFFIVLFFGLKKRERSFILAYISIIHKRLS